MEILVLTLLYLIVFIALKWDELFNFFHNYILKILLLKLYESHAEPETTKLIHDGFYRVLTMVYNTQNYWVFGLCPSSGFEIIRRKNTTFRKLDLFPSLGEGRHLLCWVPYKELTSITGRSRCLPSPEEGNRSSFRNIVFFLPII
jgi:hypothetical protein